MVLETLPEMFSQFIVDYNLHKMDMSLTELMKELQNAESILKARSGNTFTVTTGPSHPKLSGKGEENYCRRETKGKETKHLSEDDYTLRVCTGAVVSAKAVGTFTLCFENPILDDCYYVPELTRNLVFVALLYYVGYSVLFTRSTMVIKLGHINLNRIQRLVKDDPLNELEVESIPTCESCIEVKMTKRPFKAKGLRANEVLELVHSDVCGPISTRARGG
ncbi:uncharacterized protein LOC111400244 [Olea europaea var. sylvestris]|uniref:uncharacterized protein LOC111400244 n=1 Tax=Olea europaea var. sylvestris TaxID=158386 RepID=UPI000C1D00DD|nr:uncharacterized protein LOC111400244 [Olea europaea var. sylvestris]